MQFLSKRWWLLVFLMICFITACNTLSDTQVSSETSAPASPKAAPGTESPIPLAQLPQLQGKATVVLQVKDQPITIEVNGVDAPVTAGNFVDLVNRGIYDGTSFHRVVREPDPFVVQGGDPLSKDPNVPNSQLGQGGFVDPETGKTRYIPLEILPEEANQPTYSQTLKSAGITQPPKLKHTRGAVAMARAPLPDSASSQFYITLSDLAFLDGDYAVFGLVTDGMEVVDRIQQGDRIESAKVTQGLENLKQ